MPQWLCRIAVNKKIDYCWPSIKNNELTFCIVLFVLNPIFKNELFSVVFRNFLCDNQHCNTLHCKCFSLRRFSAALFHAQFNHFLCSADNVILLWDLRWWPFIPFWKPQYLVFSCILSFFNRNHVFSSTFLFSLKFWVFERFEIETDLRLI